jgi:hypothetical protein
LISFFFGGEDVKDVYNIEAGEEDEREKFSHPKR